MRKHKSAEGDTKNLHSKDMIIDRGEAEVSNHLRWIKNIIITFYGM